MIAKRMQFGLGGKVRSVSNFWTIKKTEPKAFSTKFDLGNPSAFLFIPAHSKKSTFVILISALSVMNIFRSSRLPKIGYGVVGSDAISMVKLTGRECTMHVHPCQPVSEIASPVNQNSDVSVCPDVPGYASGVSSASGIGSGKNPGLMAIVQNFAQSFCGNVCRIFGSHDAPPVRWDQGPGRVDSACLASPY